MDKTRRWMWAGTAALAIATALGAGLWLGGGPTTRDGWEAASWASGITAALSLAVTAIVWASGARVHEAPSSEDAPDPVGHDRSNGADRSMSSAQTHGSAESTLEGGTTAALSFSDPSPTEVAPPPDDVLPEHEPAPEAENIESPSTGSANGHSGIVERREVHIDESTDGVDHNGFQDAESSTPVNTQRVHHNGPHEVSWPLRVGPLPDAARNFWPRAITDQLDRALREPRTVVPHLVLSGAGGVGKTQLAAHQARTLTQADDPEYRMDVLIWADASSRARVTAAYAQAACSLLSVVPDDPEEAAKALLAWLGDPDENGGRRWLVVWDDLSKPDTVRDLWPPDHQPNGRMLVTTQLSVDMISDRDLEQFDIDVYTPEEARSFLSHALSSPGIYHTDQDMDELSRALEHLPLALGLAVAYMNECEMDCPSYLERIRSNDGSRLNGDSTLLMAIWHHSIVQANTYVPTGVALPLMWSVAHLDGAGIPVDLLTSQPVLRWLNSFRDLPREPRVIRSRWERLTGRNRKATRSQTHSPELRIGPHHVRAVLASLERMGLITRTSVSNSWLAPGPHGQKFSVVRCHQLVQSAIPESRASIPVRWKSSSNDEVFAESLVAVWPDSERGTYLGQLLFSNAQALRAPDLGDWWEVKLHWDEWHPLWFRGARSLGEAGRVSEAVHYWSRIYLVSNEAFYHDHPDVLTALSHFSHWVGESGDLDRAIALLEDLRTDRTRSLGAENPDTLTTRRHLAAWLYKSGDRTRGIELAQALLGDEKQFLGDDHPNTRRTKEILQGWLKGQKPPE